MLRAAPTWAALDPPLRMRRAFVQAASAPALNTTPLSPDPLCCRVAPSWIARSLYLSFAPTLHFRWSELVTWPCAWFGLCVTAESGVKESDDNAVERLTPAAAGDSFCWMSRFFLGWRRVNSVHDIAHVSRGGRLTRLAFGRGRHRLRGLTDGGRGGLR